MSMAHLTEIVPKSFTGTGTKRTLWPLAERLGISASNWHYTNCEHWPPFRWYGKCSRSQYLYMATNPTHPPPTGLVLQEMPDKYGALDRRKRVRAQVHWALSFSLSGTAEIVRTVTQDLSSDGFYCVANARFVPGEIMDCTLRLPTHHQRDVSGALLVLCKVRVIRVEVMAEGNLYGVGCQIADYRFLNCG